MIIDEASQATEISALIPLCHNVDKIILVGDQNQLPATVFSENAEKTLFNRSLYERFLANKIDCFTLNIQYRMHELIREFPNNQFYNGAITDDPSIKERVVDDDEGNISRLHFFNLEYTTCEGGVSKYNTGEAKFVTQLFMEQLYHKGRGDFAKGLELISGNIGVITPYKKQSVVIKRHITEALQREVRQKEELKLSHGHLLQDDSQEINRIVQVSTVDSFQGKEKDTIIISLVRVSKTADSNIGFLSDFRRMNVAITRAKNFLWVVGHTATLNSNKNWGDFIRFCYGKKCGRGFKEQPDFKTTNIINHKTERVPMNALIKAKQLMAEKARQSEAEKVNDHSRKGKKNKKGKKNRRKRSKGQELNDESIGQKNNLISELEGTHMEDGEIYQSRHD